MFKTFTVSLWENNREGDTHGYDKASVSRIVRNMSLALANKHEQQIKFPATIEDKSSIRAGMYVIVGFPCVIGCIDGKKNIRLQAPSQNEPNYINRKQLLSQYKYASDL